MILNADFTFDFYLVKRVLNDSASCRENPFQAVGRGFSLHLAESLRTRFIEQKSDVKSAFKGVNQRLGNMDTRLGGGYPPQQPGRLDRAC